MVGYVAQIRPLLAERLLAEFQQPRPDDCAVVPRPRHRFEVEVVPPLEEEFEPLTVGLHQRVLDPVVDHLHVVARPRRPHPGVAVGSRRHRVEDGNQFVVGRLWATDHQREAHVGTRGAAARPAVEVGRVGRLRPPDRVLEVGVAAVDDDVVAVEVRAQFLQCRVHRVARGDHQPDPFVRTQPLREVGDRVGRLRAGVRGRRHRLLVDVERHDVVPRVEYAVDDDPPHPAESDDSELHTPDSGAPGGSGCGRGLPGRRPFPRPPPRQHMDDRIRAHAETLVDWSARIDAGDEVVMRVAEGAHDLAVAVAAELGARGATLLATYGSDEVQRAYLRAHDGEFAPAEAERALYDRADVFLSLGGGRNTTATADVPGDVRSAYARSRADAREARMATDWVSTVHPTRSLAQAAGMSYEAYADFVYDAVLRDWASLADEMAALKDVLDDGREVRLLGEGTDLTLSIEDRVAVNSAASVAYDSHNLPSGEVFTAPATAEGEVTFDVPITVQGRRLRDAHLVFEDGAVVDFSAAAGEGALADLLATDDGAKRLGELGVGMNRGITRPTDNVLFDEKMAGTVHLALGRAYEACLPAGESGTESAIHTDFITRMDEGSRLVVDDAVIQRDGLFRWEDGFDA